MMLIPEERIQLLLSANPGIYHSHVFTSLEEMHAIYSLIYVDVQCAVFHK
jgi:hypothetical protein